MRQLWGFCSAGFFELVLVITGFQVWRDEKVDINIVADIYSIIYTDTVGVFACC